MTAGDDRRASLCVLGSISIHVDGLPVQVGGEKPRRLLAVLIANRNAVVSTERLAEVVWGDDLPDAAHATLQSYVSRLRRLLPTSARLESAAPGYRLMTDQGTIDADRFESGLASGLEDLESAPDAALVRLDEAVAEWRGDAFAEFADEWWARSEAARLEELRLHALESRVTALLALGMDEYAASQAEAITLDHPWRERPRRQMLVALHRSGRQGDALRSATEYRTRLRDDLGLDPSIAFCDLERDVATDAPHVRSHPHTTGPRRAASEDIGPPDASQGDMPHEADATGLIGRDDDLATIVDLSLRNHLVTLLGPGGIGKTRLAMRAAEALASRTDVRSVFVELAKVRDQQSVVPAVATQLQVQGQQGRSVTESVLDLLGQARMLLVLDNCEHVLDAVAGFADRLLRSCPDVQILTTSREPLALPAEHVFRVEPLPVTASSSDPASAPAVALFLRRAEAANPDFVADAPAIQAVAELCRHLDGVPLAIELAAARTRSLSPAEITERISDRFALLAGGSRAADHRHRSLTELVDWSYRLLEPGGQLLFRRLSTFAGSFDLAAAEDVCGYGDVPRTAVAPLLGSLVDKSMVQAVTGARTTYRLLETLREFGMALAGEEHAELTLRHRDWIVDSCGRGAVGLQGPDERLWLDTFDRLFDDLRLAVRNALGVEDVGTVLSIVVNAREHAFRRLRYELLGWAEAASVSDAALSHPLGAAALGIVAYGSFVRGEIDAAIDRAERAIEVAERWGTDTLGMAERALGNAWVFRDETERGTVVIDHLLAQAEASGDQARVAHACYMRSLSETTSAGTDAGLAYAERAVKAAAACGSPTARAQAAYAMGIWRMATEPIRAKEDLSRSEALAAEAGNLWFELFARTETLWISALEGEALESLNGFADVIAAWHRAGDWANQWLSLRHVFGICFLLGADEVAVTIHAALDRAGAVDAFPFEPAAAAVLTDQVDELRRRLGDARFVAAGEQGRTVRTPVLIDLIVTELRALCGG